MHDPIFLVGFMGSGKSTIGRHLAEALGRRFLDTDVFVETRFRQRITDMFAEHGEAVFRRRERMAIEELMSMPDHRLRYGRWATLLYRYDGSPAGGGARHLLALLYAHPHGAP